MVPWSRVLWKIALSNLGLVLAGSGAETSVSTKILYYYESAAQSANCKNSLLVV